MYVTKNDYKGRISSSLLDMLLEEDEAFILQQSSKVAEDTIASLAGKLYDIQGEFQKAGTARNFYVLIMAVNIALYNIYNRSDDADVPEKIIKNFDDTIDDLQKISVGKASLDLPPKPANSEGTPAGEQTASTTGTGLRRFGSTKKRTHLP